MSSTKMDFSPIMIDRKQDIASWPEGDIDQLAARDKNRYQKRKAAIIEYFQSDLPVEEISARHRLSAIDALEMMAKRCCSLHEDGQQWGFRALVPGAKVIDVRTSASSASSEQAKEAASARARLFATPDDEATQVQVASPEMDAEEDEGDTAKHQAVVLTRFTELPLTPIPAGVEEQSDPSSTPANEEAEGEQEEFPTLTTEEEIAADETVVQEDFPTALNILEETTIDAGVEQEEFPALANDREIIADEVVAQEDFPVALNTLEETIADEEVEQEEFPAPASEEEVVTDEAVAQEDFPTAMVIQEETIADEGTAQAEFPVLASEPQIVEEDEESSGEPTGKLSPLKPVAQSGVDELAADDQHELVAEELATIQKEEAGEHVEEAFHESGLEVGGEDKVTEEAEDDEMDTEEVARIVVEERRNRVASVETIKVPAAMLEALEKADQELQARTEVATPAAEVTDASATDEEQTKTTADEMRDRDEVAAIETQTLEVWRRNSRQLTPVLDAKSPTKSLTEDSRYLITGRQVAIKHAVLRRWGKQDRQQKYQNWVRIISAAIIASILVILLIPLGVGLVGYNAYTNIKNVAYDGVNNLLSIQSLIPANKNDVLSVLNTQKLASAKTNLQKAQSDFLQLQDMVNRPDIQSLLQQFAPQYSNELDMARHVVQVALDVSRMGQELIGVAQMGATILHGSGSLLSSTSTKPLFSANDVNSVEAALVHAQYYISDIQTQMSQVNLASVPFGSATQKAKLAKYLTQIPQAQSLITQVQTLVGPVAWMLGVGQTRHFLVQTLDRGELRPSGGFEGQYGLLTLQNGRLSPFSLKDITLLDYAENGNELGASPPSQYSWMNFGYFGVRDANLSADYPTTAKIVMNYFQQEGGGPLDGDIQITPVVIEQFLQLTGPIKIADYNETLTAQNLEDKLHQYQQDPRLIALQQQVTGQDTHATRKAFTNLVGTMLMDRIKHLPPSQLISFGKILLKDLKTRDLQVYLNNPVAQQWLTQNGYNGAMPQFTNGNDGFMVVQSNISISKAAQYVKSTFKDNVTLDTKGGATHNLTVTLNYQQTGPVYGFDTYADYMRIYAPANAQLVNAYGFNTGSTLCTPGQPPKKKTTTPPPTRGGGPGNGNGNSNGTTASSGSGSYTDDGITVTGCGQYYNTFTDTNARSCPDGNYKLGYDGMQARGWPIQNLGSPSLTQSDLPGYSMWGGLTLTPKNCVTTVTLSWYVPHIVQNKAGQSPYQMIVGHQAGWPDSAQISIDASALKGIKSLNYNQTIGVDTLVALPALPLPPSQHKPGGTPTATVTPVATPKKP